MSSVPRGEPWRPALTRAGRLLVVAILLGLVPWATPARAAGADPSTRPAPSILQATPSGLPRLGTEPPYATGEWPLLEVPWEGLRYNGRRLRPARVDGLVDERGVPMNEYRGNDAPVYNPTVLAEEGMMRLDSWVRTGDRVHLRRARRIAEVLDAVALEDGARRWQPHPYARFGYEPGWVNANSHGLVLSFFSRLHQLTGDEGALATADRLFSAYEPLDGEARFFSAIVDGHLWFEHYPASFRGQVLNAHINALFGLYDYWRVSRSSDAAHLFRAGLATVRDNLDRFRRRGALSAYSLTTDFASDHYHATHIRQLRILARMTGDDWFRRQARRFEMDADVAGG